jgi:hypothetical protein
MRGRSVLFAVILLGLVATVDQGTARADVTSVFNACTPISGASFNPPFTGACGTSPYGTVTLTQVGSNVDVSVALDPGFYFTDSTGAGKAIYFDLNSDTPDTSITDITAGFTLDSASGPSGSINNTFNAGTGSWEYAIECGDSEANKEPCPGGAGGSSADATSLSFVIDGITISNFVKNKDGYYFASSVYSSDPGSGQVTSNALSPEPASYLLFGSGLLGLGAIFRKRLARAV